MFRRLLSAPVIAALLSTTTMVVPGTLRGQTEVAFRSTGATASPTDEVLDRTFSTRLDRVPLKQALQVISAQTGARFAFSDALVSAGRLVSLAATNMSVREALTVLFAHTGVVVVASESGVIRLEPKQPVPDENGTIAGRVTDSAGHQLAGASVVVVGNSRFGGYTGPGGSYVITSTSQPALIGWPRTSSASGAIRCLSRLLVARRRRRTSCSRPCRRLSTRWSSPRRD